MKLETLKIDGELLFYLYLFHFLIFDHGLLIL